MVNGSCKAEVIEMTSVYSQGGEGICLAYAMTDMITIALIMSGKQQRGLRLSPQGLIDIEEITKDIKGCIPFCTSQEFGLERECDYQHTMISRELPFANAHEVFQTPPAERFRLESIALHYSLGNRSTQLNVLKPFLCRMFDAGGLRYPCVVGLYMCRLKDKRFARDIATGDYVDPVTGARGALYRPSPEDIVRFKKKTLHAMLVVGVNTDHEDEDMHYCEVKNSYGTGWGVDGFSRIPFDVIELLAIPNP